MAGDRPSVAIKIFIEDRILDARGRVKPRLPGAGHSGHHDLRPHVVAPQVRWGHAPYGMYTNSLGFRDSAPRTIPRVPAGRRLLLIGDSFTEGVGARQRGHRFVDLFPLFIHDEPPERVYARDFIQGDVHLSRAGHAVIRDGFLRHFMAGWR